MAEKEENKNKINKTSVITLQTCLENECHYGVSKRKYNPKMKEFIYTRRNGVDIIDIRKTLDKLEKAYHAAYDLTENNGKIIFVCKNQKISDEIKNDALRSGSFFVTKRWIGGTFSNFDTIKIILRNLKKLLKFEEDGGVKNLSKKEQSLFNKKKQKMLKNLEGIKEMRKLPQAIFVADPNENKIAIKEAKTMGIKIFAIVNTDCNPEDIDYAIPSNNISVKSLKLIINVISDAIVDAKCGMKNVVFKKDEESNTIMKEVIANVDKKRIEKLVAIKNAKKERQEFFSKKLQMRKARYGDEQNKKKDDVKEPKEQVEEKEQAPNRT